MFSIVFVCTGNRIRSPIAEAVVRQRFGELPVVAASAGLLEQGPRAALPEARAAAADLAIDLTEHRSRSLAEVDLTDADLVIGFEMPHIATAVVEAGAPQERTFLLREVVRLVEPPGEDDDPVAAARAAVATADARRGSAAAFDPTHAIADPFGQRPDVVVEVARAISGLVGDLMVSLFPNKSAVVSRR